MTCILSGFALCEPTAPLAITPTDAVAVGNRRSRIGVESHRHRSVHHRLASKRPARARQEVPRQRTGSPPLPCKAAIAQRLSWPTLALWHEQLGGNAVVEWLGHALYKSPPPCSARSLRTRPSYMPIVFLCQS